MHSLMSTTALFLAPLNKGLAIAAPIAALLVCQKIYATPKWRRPFDAGGAGLASPAPFLRPYH